MKVVKLLNTNKRVNKKFKSVKEATDYVKKNNLFPKKQGTKISVKIETTKELNLPFCGLNNKYKVEILNHLKNNIDSLNIDKSVSMSIYPIVKYGYNSPKFPKTKNIICKAIKEKMSFSEKEMELHFNRDMDIEEQKVENLDFARHISKQVLDNIDTDSFEFSYDKKQDKVSVQIESLEFIIGKSDFTLKDNLLLFYKNNKKVQLTDNEFLILKEKFEII